MEVAIVGACAVALVAVIALAVSLMCLTRKVAQRDTDFTKQLVNSTMETMVAAYSQGLTAQDRQMQDPAAGLAGGPMTPAIPFDVEPGPPGKAEDEDVQQVGIN